MNAPDLHLLTADLDRSDRHPAVDDPGSPGHRDRRRIAVVGSGISGLSAAWLLAKRHQVTLFEADGRPGGHSHTVDVPRLDGNGTEPVDTGFLVYNEAAYPELTALFAHLGVQTRPTTMSFGVSLDRGRLEYSGSGLAGLFAQPANLVNPRFLGMLRDLLRFYREAPDGAAAADGMTLDAWLDRQGYGRAMRDDHLYPMAAAIWSTPARDIGDYPAAAFIRFCENHQLLVAGRRDPWRTVVGGSRCYVERMLADAPITLRLGSPIHRIHRLPHAVQLTLAAGPPESFDAVVLATHADQSLAMLDDPTADETRLLSAFRYQPNRAVLHADPALMPRRRRVWSSWNYLGDSGGGAVCVSYWLNALQHLQRPDPVIVTLNPSIEPDPDKVVRDINYHHPCFDLDALAAQSALGKLQGHQRTWYCGAWFGAGFHEDGIQSGLALAEALGGVARPWPRTRTGWSRVPSLAQSA